MLIFISLIISLILCFLSYLWLEYRNNAKKLSWIPEVPGVPFLGAALDFGKSTEFLNTLSGYAKRFDGFCWLNFASIPLILVADEKVLEFLLSTTKILNKSSEYNFLHRWLGYGLLTAPGPQWKKNRKILTPAFHFSILESFLNSFDSNANIMVELLKKEIGKPVSNIYPYVTMCSLDIISEAAMGVSINAQRNIHSDYVFAVKEMCRITVERGFNFMKRFDILYPLTLDYYKEKKYVKTLHSFTQSVIDSKEKERVEKGKKEETEGKKKAFLDLLLDFRAEGHILSTEEIRQEVDTFMFEGHDTTASAISFTLYCLANHPDIQNKVLEEQKEIFGDSPDRQATYRDLQNMKILEIVIKESLRLYPSVPFFARRTNEDVEYKDGKIFPKNVNIIIYAYGTIRNPKYFKDPEKFDPWRFDQESTITRNPYSYIPFSAGPRNCIGQKFAMLELKSVVSKVIRNYLLESAGAEHEVVLAAETVLVSKNGVNVKLRERIWK